MVNMAYIRTLTFCCLVLDMTTINQASGFDGIPHPHFNLSTLGLPEIPNLGLPLDPISLFNAMPFLSGLGRFRRQIESAADMDEETQGDIPVSRDPNFVNCNATKFTSSCLNCRQVLICSNNFGLVRSCFGRNPYCSEGRCTYQQPTDCSNL